MRIIEMVFTKQDENNYLLMILPSFYKEFTCILKLNSRYIITPFWMPYLLLCHQAS